ncbi:MAG: DUF3841 domain-containing protein [Lachnospiraceae bacterium]|nr:DUF3841 domain-containing protein [Lachnospiraceae bacterium]
MILWTIQSEEVYRIIEETGVYHCNPSKSMFSFMEKQYRWLSEQMRKKIGEPPRGVVFPVWAWYKWENLRKKPDLRHERWANGFEGERFACMEIDVPDENVVLSDFDNWSIILLDDLISKTEEESKLLEEEYNSLSEKYKWDMKSKNWEQVFDLTPFENDWAICGSSVQATFWELRKEQIKSVRFFEGAKSKR